MDKAKDYTDLGFDKYMSNRAKFDGRAYTRAELNTPVHTDKNVQESRGLQIFKVGDVNITSFNFQSASYDEYVATATIPHGLGYTPFVKVLFGVGGTSNFSQVPYQDYPTGPFGVANDQTTVSAYVDNTNIIVDIVIGDDEYTGDPYPIKYYIYRNELEH